jgi:hypothetical protein
MRNADNDIARHLGVALFMVACLLCVLAVSGPSTHQSPYSYGCELFAEFHSNNEEACIADGIPLPSLRESCLSLIDNSTLNLFNEHHKIAVDNLKINHHLALTRKTLRSIKPEPICRFHLHLFLADTEDPPLLG